eukprot:TRINITY_DN7792_c0_g2_i1.p1 TRINITY_DN7792_c0_g2~~TRINITY_DN7792_c0_g2_i1.p1  ORF type:complete len:256 (+),score=20.52 TRINITY_DN7792_c0_g2_i1:138-905(+)
MTPELVYGTVSPWSARARWALEVNGVKYKRVVYTPLLSEFSLRLKLGDYFGKVSVPIMFISTHNEKKVLRDSFEIALWGNQNRAEGTRDLFPSDCIEQIREWSKLADDILNYGRIQSFEKVKKDPNALKEQTPDGFKWTGTSGAWMTGCIVSLLQGKYSEAGGGPERQKAYSALLKAQTTLNSKQNKFLIGDSFSYADIVITVATYLVKPPQSQFYTIGQATSACCVLEDLAEEFSDIILWRDDILQKYYWKNKN